MTQCVRSHSNTIWITGVDVVWVICTPKIVVSAETINLSFIYSALRTEYFT